MKIAKRPMLFGLLFVVALLSCNNEELFVDQASETIVDTDTPADPIDPDTPVEDTNSNPDAVTTPCDFTLDTVQAGDTVIIDCIMDLNGQTVTLPSNVTIVYEGGDIINGTLNFSDNSIISGELLNTSLTLGGSTPQLKDTTFNFDPQRWGIVEGIVSDEIARRNRDLLEGYFEQVKTMGVTTFSIDKMDAYFKVDRESDNIYSAEASINIPSDFSLIMTDNTHLRTQPNNYKNAVLFSVFKANNTLVEGGVFHGDRDTHDYSDGGTHEWGHLVMVTGSKNVTIQGVTIIDAGGDGVDINAVGHTYDTNYVFSENVLITGNKIIRSRRNGLSVTDGRNIIIENNEFIDSGVPTALSNGTAPQWALDIEPVWSNGVKQEIVEHVIIRNNIERGSEKGGFINARGWYITYEGNHMESTIAMGETVGSIVRNNVFENPTNSTVAIYAGMNDPQGYGNERNYDNQVYGNTIIGFQKGIMLQDPGIDLHDNIITNCGSGIQILNSRDSKIRNNTITSNVYRSEGIANHVSEYINNVDIYDNVINVMGSPFRFTNVNMGDSQVGFSFTVRGNEVTSNTNTNSSYNKVRGFNFKDNICHNSGIRTETSSIGNVLSNIFENGSISITKECSDINFIGNTITGGKCFSEDSTTQTNIVKENNTCN